MSDLYFQVPAPSYAAGYTLPMVEMWDGQQLLGEITPEQVQQLTAQRDALAAACKEAHDWISWRDVERVRAYGDLVTPEALEVLELLAAALALVVADTAEQEAA